VAGGRREVIGKLIEVELADEDCPGAPEPNNRCGILARYTRGPLRTGRRCAHARGVEQIFHRDRNSLQRSGPVRSARVGQCLLSHHRDEGIQPRVQPFNLRERRAREFKRRNPPRAHPPDRLRQSRGEPGFRSGVGRRSRSEECTARKRGHPLSGPHPTAWLPRLLGPGISQKWTRRAVGSVVVESMRSCDN